MRTASDCRSAGVRPKATLRGRRLAILTLLVVSACSSEGPVEPNVKAHGATIVSGGEGSDTIEALLPEPMVVRVLSVDRNRMVNTAVQLSSLPGPSQGEICAGVPVACAGSQLVFTDGNGEVRVRIRMSKTAGTMGVIAAVPSFPNSDTTTFTVRPGAISRVVAFTSEVRLDVGGSVTVTGRTCDRFCNTRPETPRFFAGPGAGIAVDSGTGVVRALDMGTYRLYARVGAVADSTDVSVVPPGRLIAFEGGVRPGIYFFNVNYTQRRTAFTAPLGATMDYLPRARLGRNLIAAVTGAELVPGSSPLVLRLIDSTAATVRTYTPPTPITNVVAARVLPDSSVIAILRLTAPPGPNFHAVYRFDANGTTTKLVELPLLGILRSDGADIAPDGASIAYLAMGAQGPTELRTLDLATGATRTLVSEALAPAYSPDGRRIAYLGASVPGSGQTLRPLMLIGADGTNVRRLGSTAGYAINIAWSADGTLILGRSGVTGAFRVVRVADAAEVSLRFFDITNAGFEYTLAEWW
jgi:WD40-like Beta Propeller Repeat